MRQTTLAAVSSTLLCLGCASQSLKIEAAPGQEMVVRDGIPALISKKNNLVMLRPNMKLLKGNDRPAFTVAVRNFSNKPETLLESGITAKQTVEEKQVALKVLSYDELVQEEKTRQAVQAFGAALSGISRAYTAANAGYVNTTGTVNAYGPYGASYGTYTATSYDPLRAQLAQQSANAQTQSDFAIIQSQGEQNLEQLQAVILKDNTVMPGEWIGGTIVLEPPQYSSAPSKSYAITVNFAGEQHEFLVSQVAN